MYHFRLGAGSNIEGQEGHPDQSTLGGQLVHSKLNQGGLCMGETSVLTGDDGWGGLVRWIDEKL